MTREHSHGSVGNYILVALVLGVITYFEFAIVEHPQAWLGQTWTFAVLAVLSVTKFVMVVMFFMHLKGDDRLYSVFFSSGMLMAVLSFIAFTAMFILPRAMSYADAPMVVAKEASALYGTATPGDEGGHVAGVDEETLGLIATDGRSRSAAARADTPGPADRSLAVAAPEAANDASTYEVAAASPAVADLPAADSQTAAEDAAEAAAAEEEAAAGATVAWDEAQGKQVFTTNCSSCHQVTGLGIPGAFPPVANHLGQMHEAGGREQLIRTILFGLQGQIKVDGMDYNGFMPGWAQLDDASIANTLNYVIVSLGDGAPAGFTPYVAAEVEAHRGDGLTAAAVHELRAELPLD